MEKHKASSNDGISHDIFRLTWLTTQYDMLEIMNQMFVDEKLMDSKKHGIIVGLEKIPRPIRLEVYRILTPPCIQISNCWRELLQTGYANGWKTFSILVNIVESRTITH